LKLSVVIAAHDAEPFLGAAIDSVLADLPADSELIVVDDGSTDGTPHVLAGYGDRARLFRNETASGPGDARNLGARAASGEILAFHDADDLVLPGRFATLIAALDRHPEVDLVFGNGIKIDETGRPLGPVIPARYVRRLKRRAGPAEMLTDGFVYPQALCIRRERFLALGGFIHERVEDWEFALRASLFIRLLYVDRAVFAYRRHPGSMTMQQHAYAHAMLAMLERFVAEHPDLPARVPPHEIRHARARRFARAAKHRLRAGDVAGAAAALSQAVALAPRSLRYRWRLLRLRRSPRSAAPPAT
jgi:glycosyltransferase involved in cell wall biosynthesis